MLNFPKLSRNDLSNSCLGLFFLAFITYLSFRQGEKLHFLVPLLLVPIYLFQCFYLLPVIKMLTLPGHIQYEGENVVISKPLTRGIIFIEIVVSLSLLTFGYLSENFVLSSIIYACYAIFSTPLAMVYLARRFYLQAKNQRINSKFKIKAILDAIRTQYANMIFPLLHTKQ